MSMTSLNDLLAGMSDAEPTLHYRVPAGEYVTLVGGSVYAEPGDHVLADRSRSGLAASVWTAAQCPACADGA